MTCGFSIVSRSVEACLLVVEVFVGCGVSFDSAQPTNASARHRYAKSLYMEKPLSRSTR